MRKKKTVPNTLVYHLPTDADELHIVLNAGKYLAALQEYDNELRQLYKYQDVEWAGTARELLRDVLKSFDVELWR